MENKVIYKRKLMKEEKKKLVIMVYKIIEIENRDIYDKKN